MIPVQRFPGRRRGFTLIELVVALVLTSGLVLLSLRWVATLSLLTGVSGDTQNVQRSVSFAAALAHRDISEAQRCDMLIGPVAGYGPDSFSVFRDVDGDGAVERVTWSVTDGVLLRSVTEPASADPCEFVTVSERVVVAYGVRNLDVVSLIDAGTVTAVTVPVDCVATGGVGCDVDGFVVKLVVDADGSVVFFERSLLLP